MLARYPEYKMYYSAREGGRLFRHYKQSTNEFSQLDEFDGSGENMINVTRLNGKHVTINADLIELVEATPDTIITTMTGKKILVQNSVDEVIDKIVAYRQRCVETIRINK